MSPSKRASEKYKPRGLFSEFYGICSKKQMLPRIFYYLTTAKNF